MAYMTKYEAVHTTGLHPEACSLWPLQNPEIPTARTQPSLQEADSHGLQHLPKTMGISLRVRFSPSKQTSCMTLHRVVDASRL